MPEIPDKSVIRRKFRQIRDEFALSLRPQDKALCFSALPSPLKSLFTADKCVAAYVPIGSEADPMTLLNLASAAGCVTALPHITGNIAPMRFLNWSPGDVLMDGPFGLKQPQETATPVTPDIILIPLIAFDRTLNRIGQGAGHYDRALSVIDDAISIGVAWSVQETDMVPADPWDMPLDAILTEKEWITI